MKCELRICISLKYESILNWYKSFLKKEKVMLKFKKKYKLLAKFNVLF